MERSELEINLGVVNIKMAFKAMEVHEITKGMNRQKRGPRTKPWGTLPRRGWGEAGQLAEGTAK